MRFEVTTLKRRPELAEQVDQLAGEAWPTFMLHADTPYWDSLFGTLAGFRILFCDPADTLIALGHTIPFVWDGTLEDLPPTIDEVMEKAIDATANAVRQRHSRPWPHSCRRSIRGEG